MSTVISTLASGVEGLSRIMPKPGIDLTGLSRAVNRIFNGSGQRTGTDFSDLAQLLEQQKELQGEMLWINMQSNILRTEHESRMAPARNMRVA